jgi:RimJ/RimL family protein N-acetyltransferase
VSEIHLRAVDGGLLAELLRVAVAEAEPEQVMPPVGSGPGWTGARRDAFLRFHTERLGGLAGPRRTVMYAVIADGAVVGMIRMSARDPAVDRNPPTVMETGIWLGRAWRGRGIGVAALRALLVEAVLAGAHTVVAETTAGNLGAVGALRRCGALLRRDGDAVYARIPLARPAGVSAPGDADRRPGGPRVPAARAPAEDQRAADSRH